MTFQLRSQRLAGCAALLACLFVAGLSAQATQGELRGTVRDQTGAVVAGASVMVFARDGRSRSTTTDGEGKYHLERLPEGRSTMLVRRGGFMEYTGDIDLQAERTVFRDVVLKVAIAVKVDVKEREGLSADPRRNLSALILTGKDLAALPDDPQLLLFRALQMAGASGRPGDVAVYVNGFREYRRLPQKNTIEMIRINSNPFSAEFAEQGARRVEIVTKAGSDTFHGDVGLQLRTSAMDAQNPVSETKPDTSYSTAKGYLQGPIIKDHASFLVSGGFWQQDDNAFVHATILSLGARSVEPFGATVATPTNVRSGSAQVDVRAGSNTINASFARADETDHSLGLQSGFDLPEHAYDRTASDNTGRLWWTSLGRRTVNDVRIEVTRGLSQTLPLTTTPAVIVLDAFNAGGNQAAPVRRAATGWLVSDALTMQRGSHTFKTGGQVESAREDYLDRSGFGGTYTFGADVERDALGRPVLNPAGGPIPISPIERYRRTILGAAGYVPSQFLIVRGDPELGIEQRNLGFFFVDDWSLSRQVTFSYGVRQDIQNDVPFRMNLAPRASVAWLPDAAGKNVIRFGTGIFYRRVEPQITLDTMRFDGVNRQQFTVETPSFFPGPPTIDGSLPVHSTVYTKAEGLRVPRSLVSTISYERQLPGNLYAVAQYLFARGADLLRLRDITAPATGYTGASPNPVLQFESTGRSLQHQLMIGLRQSDQDMSFYANYVYGTKRSDTDNPYTLPANSNDLTTEFGWAADDQRHQLVAGASLQFDALLLNPSISIATGRPFNVTTGLDNNHDTLFMDRPSFAESGDPGAIATQYGLLNPNPRPGETIVPRNLGREPMQITIDLSATQTLATGVTLTVDLQNLLNADRLYGTNGVLTAPLFGVPNQALNGRRLWLALRFAF